MSDEFENIMKHLENEIEFKVCDGDTGEIVGYEYFNTNLNTGYYYIDLSELKEGQVVGDLICHTENSEKPMLTPKDPMGKLVRYLYTGFVDTNGYKLYYGDSVTTTESSWAGVINKQTVAIMTIRKNSHFGSGPGNFTPYILANTDHIENIIAS